MIYIVTLTVGLISGFIVPGEYKAMWALLGMGILFLMLALVSGLSYSYSNEKMIDLFTLVGNFNEVGVRQFVVVGYSAMIGGVLAGVRSVTFGFWGSPKR